MKRRLDVALVERGLARSRERAQRLIRAGSVEVNGQIATKAGTRVSAADEVAVLEPLRYVGRGGLKLEHALDAFGLDVEGATALDVGASTGGFTDCLLQRGAAHVYAVDVGRGQLVPEIREHPRVTPLEGTDIRQLGALPEPIDLAVIDVSFISLTRALPAGRRLLKPGSGARRGAGQAAVRSRAGAGRARWHREGRRDAPGDPRRRARLAGR